MKVVQDSKPEISVLNADVNNVKCDLLIVNLFANVKKPGGATGAVDSALDGLITKAIAAGELTGTKFETRVYNTWQKIPAEKILVVGLGKPEEWDPVVARQVAASAIKTAAATGARHVASIIHGAGIGGMDPLLAARALLEGTLFGLYRFDKYKNSSDDSASRNGQVERFIVVEREKNKIDSVNQAISIATKMGQAVNFARDLANEPPNIITPPALAERARSLANALQLEYEVWSGSGLQEAGFEAIYAVGRGSPHTPQLVRIDYRGRAEEVIDLAIIGKGVTFDSGGLSLKPADSMTEMKFDMSGAAAILGTVLGVTAFKPSINIMFLTPLVENLPGGYSMRPGDIIKTFSGKTVEVNNTDAEGRLILADAVAYAQQQGATAIVDVATLTGAAVIALGHHATAIIGNDEELLRKVEAAASAAGERVWRLPALPEYKEQIKSSLADLKNTGGRAAGAITGGLFVGAFAEKTPWVHLDIAGTAWTSEPKPYCEQGATGVMTRTLIELCRTWDN